MVHHFPSIVSVIAGDCLVGVVLVVVALELFLAETFEGDFLPGFDGALAAGPASAVILPPDAWPS